MSRIIFFWSFGMNCFRVSTFFTTRADGTLDIWDFLQHQKHSTLAVRVCDDKLTCLRPHDSGRLIAVGNQIGTTYLVELSKNLSFSSRTEKTLFTAVSTLAIVNTKLSKINTHLAYLYAFVINFILIYTR